MLIESTPELAMQAADTLEKHDFAFVKRSNGSYSYAILARRTFAPMKGHKDATEECMTFVTDESGSTKTIRQRNWSKCLRLVSL